jgi:hypothetical protein
MNQTRIIRSVESTPNNYTPLSNKLLQNNNLDIDTRGLLCYLISLPADWVIYKENIQKQLGFGRKKMDRMWNQAKQFGYLKVDKFRKSDGTWEYNYTISDVPLSNVPSSTCGVSNDGLSNVGKGNTIQSNHIQNTEIQNKEVIKKEGASIDSIDTRETETHTPSFSELYYKGVTTKEFLNNKF